MGLSLGTDASLLPFRERPASLGCHTSPAFPGCEGKKLAPRPLHGPGPQLRAVVRFAPSASCLTGVWAHFVDEQVENQGQPGV